MGSLSDTPEFEALVRKYGNPIRVFAESCILRFIGELNGEAQTRYQEFNSICYPNGDGIDDLSTYASVTLHQIAAIREFWKDERLKDPDLRPIDFARQHARDIFYPNLDVPEL